MKNKPGVAFFGTPHFAEIILRGLINSPYKPGLVVTAPDKPVGRKKELSPSPVKILAKENKIDVWQPENLTFELWNLEFNKLGNVGLVIVAAYGKIIPKEILDIPKHGALNVHPSLLPKYRGAAPIQNAILNGDKKTGATVMLMDEKMDHGPILAQKKIGITGKDTYETLGEKLFNISADLLVETIPKYLDGKIKPKEQNHDNATYTKIITREDGLINWEDSAEQIERRLRAFTPWPGIYTYIGKKRLKLLSVANESGKTGTPGEVLSHKNGFAVQTKKGIIVPQKVQIEGKKPQSAKEFLQGHPKIAGMVLG